MLLSTCFHFDGRKNVIIKTQIYVTVPNNGCHGPLVSKFLDTEKSAGVSGRGKTVWPGYNGILVT